MVKIDGLTVEVLSLRDENTAEDIREWLPISPQVFTPSGPAAFGYAPKLCRHLTEIDSDFVRVDGLWTYPSVACLKWFRVTKRPYMVAPRGMLDPWALDNSRWKKRIARWLFENTHLHHAACLHALCESEAKAMREFGLKNPICIIPNGIDLPEITNQESEIRNAPWAGYVERGKRVLLFLSRIHPKKGLVNLLRAWKATLNSQPSTLNSWVLAIAGWDQGGHEAKLKRLATELGLPWADLRRGQREVSNSPSQHNSPPSILFLGPQFNVGKSACFRECDAFILPSFSEGLPMVALEAWTYGKPVLITPQCNLPEGFGANAAIRIQPEQESIAKGLESLLSMTEADRKQIGENGRQLVLNRFCWPTIGTEMRQVCDWLVGGGKPPVSVI